MTDLQHDRIVELETEIAEHIIAMNAQLAWTAILTKLRSEGWSVAVHNDYMLAGEAHTFWLLTRGDRCIKGEGRTDDEALYAARAALQPKDEAKP